jgi:AcrR family transcriptional regulator
MAAAARLKRAAPGRNPERTRERILVAALHEFAARGFAGARVDMIARRAPANKRMIYHYFGDKGGLFRAVIKFKLDERMARFKSYASAGLGEGIPLLFRQNCEDLDWCRLLAWESLQSPGNRVHDEQDRRRRVTFTNALIRRQQKEGKLNKGMRAEHFHLAMASLAIFPLVMPQLARLILGKTVMDKNFQRDYAKFLETISAAFRP